MDVGMEMDCPQGEEDATFDALKASVEQKLVDTIKENKESVGVLIGEAKKKLEDNIEG
jgi:ribosomal protein L7/L12